MANDFKCFMAENAIKAENKQYVASERFVSDGTPVPWELQVVSNDVIDRINKNCRRKEFNRKTGANEYRTDTDLFNAQLVCASVVYPNLNDSSLQTSYNVVGAEALVKTMLTPGEYADLVAAVVEVCGFQTDMNDKIKEAKN